MNIKIITQNFPPRIGGIQNVMYSLAKNFSNLGFNVHVMPDHFYFEPQNFKITNFYFPKILRPFTKRIYLSFLKSTDELVFCDTWKSVKSIPQKYKNIVVFAHGQEFLNKERNYFRIAKSLSKAKFLISSSNYTLDLIKRSWDISNLKSTVIYPTYHIKKFNHKKPRSQDKKIINFISICRVERRKGLLESLRSLRVILDKGYQFSWDIIGDGPELKNLKNETAKLKLTQHVQFHGKIKDNVIKDDYLKNSDVFLMPSFQDKYSVEGFGLSYIEAAKFGIPSIAGNSGGAPEATINKKTGWCVNTHNKENLVYTLTESITNTKLRNYYGQNALKRFETKLNSDIVSNQLVNFLQN